MPYDLRTAIPIGLDEDYPDDKRLWADIEVSPGIWKTVEINEDQHRIIEGYREAAERQHDARDEVEKRRNAPPGPTPEPEPEAVSPEGTLRPRQEEFCRHYAANPVATRAAVLAGYEEENAANQGYRLLKNPLVLERIARLRAERNLRYVVDPDTLHDKLEAVFFEALAERNHAAAVAALRLQAGLARLPTRPVAALGDDGAPARVARSKPEKSRVRRRKKPRKADQKAEKSR